MIWETVRLALRSVRRNALRSFLTLLGIVIGVAAVIAMLTIGAGTTEKVKADIAKLGSNLLVVRAGRPPGGGPGGLEQQARKLGDKELIALREHLVGARAISTAAQKQVRVIYGTESLVAGVTGTESAFLDARDWKLASGRAFSDSESRSGTGVCLIGETVRQQFFGAGDPEGETIRVNRTSCKVVGLLESKGYTGFGQDQDNVVLMPLAAFQRRPRGGLVPTFLRARLASRRPALWKERTAVGILRPSLSISKRRAPASGIASASRTVTSSPRR